jgi:hypothetical protein
VTNRKKELYLKLAKVVREQTLQDGQKVGSTLLWAEVKMGELLNPIIKEKGYGRLPSSGGRKPVLPDGITWKSATPC